MIPSPPRGWHIQWGSSMKTLLKIAPALLLVVGAPADAAQGVINNPRLSAALANELVGETVAICASRGTRYGPSSSISTACARPCCAATGRRFTRRTTPTTRRTGRLADPGPERGQHEGSCRPDGQEPAVGCAVFAAAPCDVRGRRRDDQGGGQPIGAIGVSGAPGGALDEACAREALAKIEGRMK